MLKSLSKVHKALLCCTYTPACIPCSIDPGTLVLMWNLNGFLAQFFFLDPPQKDFSILTSNEERIKKHVK